MDGATPTIDVATSCGLQRHADRLGLGFAEISASGDLLASNTAFTGIMGPAPSAAAAALLPVLAAAPGQSATLPIGRPDSDAIHVRADIMAESAAGARCVFVREVASSQPRAASEEMRLETLRRFDILTDRSGMGMWLAGPDNRIIEANGAMARLMNLPDAEALAGLDAFALAPPQEQRRLREALSALPPDGAASVRHNLAPHNGLPIRVQSDMTRDPTTGGCITFVRDVTEEEQLVRDLAARNQDLEHFSIAASHDLREPMRKITAFAGMLEEDLDDVMSDAARKDLAVISDAARRMSTLVEMLSVYVNLKGSIGAPQLVSLQPLITDIMAELNTPADLNLSVDAPEPLFIDKAALKRLCCAVLSNCIAYRREDRALTITAEAKWKTSRRVLLTFTDNGNGVPKNQRIAVLTPLKRLRTRGSSPGSGMGLAICARIAEYYNGYLKVGASSSGGAEVLIELQLDKPEDGLLK